MKPQIPANLYVLKKICRELSLSFRIVDNFSNNLAEVSNGKKKFFAGARKTGMYPLNSGNSAGLVNDKAWTYMVLKRYGYKIPKGQYFFLKKDYRKKRGLGQEIEDAIKYTEDKYPVFVKPNDGSLGILAEKINNEKSLIKHLKKISKNYHIAIIQENIKMPEYRIFSIDGEIEFIYQKPNERVYIENISSKTRNWVKKIHNDLNIRVCGIDIFADDINDPKNFIVIELNNSPGLYGTYKRGYERLVLDIWKKILKKYFDKE